MRSSGQQSTRAARPARCAQRPDNYAVSHAEHDELRGPANYVRRQALHLTEQT